VVARVSFPVSSPVVVVFGPGVTRMVDPLGFFPWGVVVEAGGSVAAPLAGSVLARAAAAAAAAAAFAALSPSVVLVATMVLVASFCRNGICFLLVVAFCELSMPVLWWIWLFVGRRVVAVNAAGLVSAWTSARCRSMIRMLGAVSISTTSWLFVLCGLLCCYRISCLMWWSDNDDSSKSRW